MSSKEIQKWNMLAPTFDTFEIPNVLQDNCLKLIEQNNLMNKNSVVMDLGCGAGRYSIAFATKCSHVVGTDLSPDMIAFANQRKKQMNLSNLTFICEDFNAVSTEKSHYENQFDLVFAHFTPAVDSRENLLKMQSCSRNWCMLVRHISMETPIFTMAKNMLGFTNEKKKDSYTADKVFSDLWQDGKHPYMFYFNEKRDSKRPVDIELSLLFEDLNRFTQLTPLEKEQITKEVMGFTKDGMVHQTYEVPIFAACWQV